MKERRGGGLTDVGENPGDGLRVSEERDEGEGGPAGGADQREDPALFCSGPRRWR